MDKAELIQRYFLEDLGPDELKYFMMLLEKDRAFRSQVELEKDVRLAIRHRERSKIKAKLQEFEEEKGNRKSVKYFVWRPWAAAASVILLCMLGWYIFAYNSLQGLYEEYYSPYPNKEVMLTRGNAADNLEQRAFAAYESGEYQEAAELFLELKESGDHGYEDFYLGQVYLQSGNTAEAIERYEAVTAREGKYKEEALWYLALAHLKNRDKVNATNTLNELVVAGYPRAEEAGALLERLD